MGPGSQTGHRAQLSHEHPVRGHHSLSFTKQRHLLELWDAYPPTSG